LSFRDDVSESSTSPRRRSESADTTFDPRTVIGWRVTVPGFGTGVVKDVRKSLIFGKCVYDIDFGTGKLFKVTTKLNDHHRGLPFSLVKHTLTQDSEEGDEEYEE